MITNILTNRKVMYTFQVLVFAWACASTIHISLNMFLWLLNGIFLGLILYNHYKKNEMLTEKNWSQLLYLVTKIIILLKVLLESYKKASRLVLKKTALSDKQRDDFLITKTELIDHATREVAEIETIALMLRTEDEANASDN